MPQSITDPGAGFAEPLWNAGLDVPAELERVPEQATISGMFIAPLVAEIQRRGLTELVPRRRYVTFQFYPLREHMQLLTSTCAALYPDRPMRDGLRKLGRGAPVAFVSSTLGRVMLGSADGVQACVAAFAKGYELNMRPGRAHVLQAGPGHCVVRMEDVYSFLDSHHVGAFEGVIKHAGSRGTVRIHARSTGAADLFLRWG